jgi:hypothetical protein
MRRGIEMKKTIKLHGKKIRVDCAWSNTRESIGVNGFDVACYIGDGVSVWPCGEFVDVKEKTGDTYCTCATCGRVRVILDGK